jgi:outer membrane protein assembly factor BamB
MRRNRPGAVDADIVEVDLVEESDAEETGNPAAEDAHPRQGRTARWLAVGVLLTIAVGVVSVNVIEARAAAARRDALAGTPRLLESLAGPPSEVWRRDGALFAEGEGVLVLIDAARTLTGVRAEDGVPLWTRETAASGDEQCSPLVTSLMPLSAVESLPAQDHLVCMRSASIFADELPSGSTTEVSAIAVATGEEVQTTSLPGGLFGWLPVPNGLVIATFGAGGRVLITCWDPVTGAVSWSHESEQVFADASLIRWELTDATIAYGQDDAFVTVSFDTGAESDTTDVARLAEVFALPDGGSVAWRIELASAVESVAVVEADGSERFRLDGSLRWPVVRDPRSGLLLVQPDGTTDLVALDILSGETVWTAEAMGAAAPLVEASGVVVLSRDTSAVAVDARDGTTVWSAPMAPGTAGVTDGVVVVLLEPDGVGLSLVAHDLEHGVERWRVEVPPETLTVRSAGGITLLSSDSGVVALR